MLEQALNVDNRAQLREENALKQKAFAELYHTYSPALYGAINKVLKSPALSQDVLQNTFIKIWQHGASYDSCKGSLFTWMLNIACHEAIDTLRSKRHKQARVTGSLNEALLVGSNPFVRLDHIDVYRQLFILKPMDRVILELHYFRGYTCQQTAELLQLPCGTVKSRMQYSYKVLRAAFLEPTALSA